MTNSNSSIGGNQVQMSRASLNRVLVDVYRNSGINAMEFGVDRFCHHCPKYNKALVFEGPALFIISAMMRIE